MIDHITIDRIYEAAKIVDVVSEFVTLRRSGANYKGCCPFHEEKTPSFMVSPSKEIFKCFGCGKGGNAVHFIMEHEQLSYFEALKFLAKKYNIEFQERELTEEEKTVQSDRESMFLVNEFAKKHFSDNLLNTTQGRAVGLAYFHERGFRDDVIGKFQLGYALESWDDLAQNAVKQGYKKEFLLKTGLCFENDKGGMTDRFRARVMFPVHSLSGKTIAFGGRILKKDDKTAKYVNSPESEIYHKSNELYGIYFAKQAIVKQNRCFLVEGYTDVIQMHQSGIENVVASSGTSLTTGQIRLIHRFTENVTVIYDGDAAGIKASIRGIDLLLEEGLNIKVLLLPDGEDPDSFVRKHNANDFVNFVEQNSVDFIRFKTQLLLKDAAEDPIKRAALIGDVVRSIAVIPNALIRAEYVKECSALLSVAENLIYDEIGKIRKNQQEQRFKEQKRQEERSAENAEKQIDNVETKVETKIAPNEKNAVTSVFEQQEREILKLLFRNGTETLFEEEGKIYTVADYAISELQNDAITFRTAIFAQVFDEFSANYKNDDFSIKAQFIHNQNAEISVLAIDLLEDKYVLSKIFKIEKPTENLQETTLRLIYEYKNSIILEKIKQKILELKTFSEQSDFENADRTMQELANLENVKNALHKELGERVITKL